MYNLINVPHFEWNCLYMKIYSLNFEGILFEMEIYSLRFEGIFFGLKIYSLKFGGIFFETDKLSFKFKGLYFDLEIQSLRFQTGSAILFSPETGSDVFKLPRVILSIETLVGRWLFEGAKMFEIRPYLDVVEVCLVDSRRDAYASTVPRHLVLRMLLVDILRQHIDPHWIVIATHKGNTGDVLTIFFHEGIQGLRIQRQPDVLPEIMAVATRTVTRAIRDVDGQCHFVGYLLKDNVRINVLQHHDQLAWA